ncbi:MAG: FkbM family methyltransferase [Planctomycetota bacterium]|nr:MAG: FkbM family methyltransferase [Planctomycetota bacterium]
MTAGPIIYDSYPFSWRAGIERIRQVWRVALHPKFRAEIRLLAPFIPHGAGCLDIGANHGRFALELARLGHRVLAFEPLAFNLVILRKAALMSKNLRISATALGEHTGSAALYVPLRADRRPRHGSAFVCMGDEHEAQRLSGGASLVRQEIEIRRLDDVDLTWVGRVGFIKMDVEGHEAAVIRGGAGLLERDHPSILAEISRADCGLEALRELTARGYVLYDLDLCEAGAWSSDAEALHGRITDKSHDVLAWHGSRGPAPRFGAEFATTRFGS